jgi:hypothetical protein
VVRGGTAAYRSPTMMEKRRTWNATIDGVDHQIEVVYAALSGWMTIEIDGQRSARGWREFQTVFGGATLSCALGRHRVDARVTQPWGQQQYAFALAIDGALLPGSDPQPEPRALKRQTVGALAALAIVIFFSTLAVRLLS